MILVMRNLLFKAYSNPYVTHSMFPPEIRIYDEFIYFRIGNPIWKTEISITYNHISHINLKKGMFFADIDITSTGSGENIHMKGVWTPNARKVKTIIEQKLFQANASHDKVHHKIKNDENMGVSNYESSLNRLKELLNRGKITKSEYNSRRSRLLKNLE